MWLVSRWGPGLWAGRLRAPFCPAGGSFRHFLWQVCRELQSSSLSLLLLCPSSAVNKNKVRRGA